MRRMILFVPLLASLALFAEDKRKPAADTRDQVGTDQVTVYWCGKKKEFWTQSADSVKVCPFCGEGAKECGKKSGDYKVVLKSPRGAVKPDAEVSFDVEVFQIVMDKDSKPDEVRVMDIATIDARLTTGTEKNGEFIPGESGPVIAAAVGGPQKIGTFKSKLGGRGLYRFGFEINRGGKEKVKIESEVRFSIE